jgi:hypothetical protein
MVWAGTLGRVANGPSRDPSYEPGIWVHNSFPQADKRHISIVQALMHRFVRCRTYKSQTFSILNFPNTCLHSTGSSPLPLALYHYREGNCHFKGRVSSLSL